MKKLFLLAAVLQIGTAQQPALKRKYIELTESWTHGVTFKAQEQRAMEAGRRVEALMTSGLDDPLAKKILAGGEPSFEALAAAYPGKVLDRTLLGTYSDPRVRNTFDNEFAIWWNGAISADLRKGQLNGAVQPLANNTNIVFRVGAAAEMFGRDGERYSRIGYEDGYLPIVTATYDHDGLRYRQTALADKPPEPGGERGDIAHVRFEISNLTDQARPAELHADVILVDETVVQAGTRAESQRIVDGSGALLLAHSDRAARFDAGKRRLTHAVQLPPRGQAAVYYQIPYLPDSQRMIETSPELSLPVSNGKTGFDAAYGRVRRFWTGLLARGAQVTVPEERVNHVWRALLLQNFILADGPRFTYGSGLRYNDSYYPQENGFGAHTFAMFGHPDYAAALAPYAVPVSVRRDQAGRKYQNRRAMPLHHLLENYRLTKKTGVFEKHKEELDRAAEEIISDRRSNMNPKDGARPLHWGLLPPDRPGVDLRASTQTVYVLGHNITNCQGLQDFGRFLVETGLDKERGERYLSEARDFRRAILEAMERSAIRVPGRPPFVDLQTLYFRETPEYGPEPYDDLALGRVQGTYYHYWADMIFQYNFFNPADAVGRWIADYVAARGGFVLGNTRARLQPGQPYGWINNVYNAGYYNYRLRAGAVDEFLLGFYARLAFGMSRHVYVASEGSPFIGYNTRHGGLAGADYSFPNSAANAETLLMLRLMLVMEELRDNTETGDLYLLAGAPRRWLNDGERIRATKLPTYYGDISFEVHSRVAQGEIQAEIEPPRRDPYRTIIAVFRHPKGAAIRRVKVNGAEHRDVDVEKGLVRLPSGPARFSIEVYYED